GDENHRAARTAESRQGGTSWRVGLLPVVHDPPDVAEDHMVAAQEGAGVGEDGWHHGSDEMLRRCSRRNGCAPLEAGWRRNTMGEMMHLSYAQNMEDYHLDLIFAGQDGGCYVDVGAGHPVADNVSFHFYLKGWRGLVVEPQVALAELYAHVRPRDEALSCLAGRAEGEVDFYLVDKLHGFSSTVREHAVGAAQFGASYQTIRKRVRPLGALIDAAGLAAIDFLKIDVEGAEGEVLAGMDFARQRPRLLLIEAVQPGSMAEAWGESEPALLAQGYQFAFFDRLNRFYVADEANDLLARFPAEPA